MSHIVVHLDWYEQYWASCCGLLRRAMAIQNKSPNAGGKPNRDRQLMVDIDGAGGEAAFAKYFNLNWPAGVNTYKKLPDILPDFEIKTTPHADGHLIVEDGDPPDRRYVLVCGTMPDYVLVGWMGGADVKQPKYLRLHERCGPTFWVPQIDLRGIEELALSLAA